MTHFGILKHMNVFPILKIDLKLIFKSFVRKVLFELRKETVFHLRYIACTQVAERSRSVMQR